MVTKKYSLTDNTIEILERLYEIYDVNFTIAKQISGHIVRLSDTYKDELTDHSNIWSSPSFLKAYLAYFLPLNTIRLTAVLEEVQSFLKLDSLHSIYDYGSGPGTSHLALENLNIKADKIFNFDKSKQALKIHEFWSEHTDCNFTSDINTWDNINSNSIGIFSYAFNEFKGLPELISKHDHLLIIEPSNQAPARRLQQHREKFNDMGYKMIAPCTHQNKCPLLTHSKKDWCHSRVFTELPSWFTQLEKFIPMKNSNITYSYLFVSKKIEPITNPLLGRVIGDTLKEKGKTRQAFCRSNDREFLAWLKKNGKYPEIPRGSLYTLSPDHELKSNEIRKP